MQVSNPAISQYLSSTVNSSQQADRFPVKSVTIEGQLIDDEKKQSEANKTRDSDFGELVQSGNEAQAELIAPATAPQVPQNITFEPVTESLLIQKKLNGSTVLPSQNESLSAVPNFPYGHRRSYEGLAGGPLVIQKYLNNEPAALTQPDNSQRNIDLFI